MDGEETKREPMKMEEEKKNKDQVERLQGFQDKFI